MTPDVPRYVVTSQMDATAVLRQLSRQGWTTREGFALTDAGFDVSGGRIVRYGRVGDRETAELVVHAAARGAGVVVIADLTTDLGKALWEDLSRIGPVRRHTTTQPDSAHGADAVARLIPEQRALLERLANGETIAAAAAAEFLSLRTANRRIAQARELFGVRTTREAVLAYLRHRGNR